MTAQPLDAAGTEVRVTEVYGYPLPPRQPGRREVQHSADGRYLVTDPETGKRKPYTRMTTLVHTLDDDYYLRRWERRQWAAGGYLLGVQTTADVIATAAGSRSMTPAAVREAIAETVDTPLDRRARETIADEAEVVTGMGRAAEFGTAVHEWCAHIDLGHPLTDVPTGPACHIDREVKGEQMPDGSPRVYRSTIRDRVADYIRVRAEAGLTPLPDFIERTVWTRIRIDPWSDETVEVVGTLDNIMLDAAGNYVLVDKKTSPDMEYTYNSWTAQLTGYASATCVLDPVTGEWQPAPWSDGRMPLANIVVLGLPSAPQTGAPIPVPTVTTLSLDRGAELLRHAAHIRIERRKARARDLALAAPALPVPAAGSDEQRRGALIAALQSSPTLHHAAQVYAENAEDIGRLGLLDYAAWLAEHLPSE